jgi:hypothetical protein
MTHGAEPTVGWIINGFQSTVFLWVWAAVVLLYGLWRSWTKPDPDPIRSSGPTRL